MALSLIVALDANGLIGSGGELPWRLPADLKRFKELTMGKPIIMGRKTCESIGRPLPGRRNIVLTRDPAYRAEGFEVFQSLENLAAAFSSDWNDAFVIGGAEIYRLLLDRAARAYVTLVDSVFDGDVHFPQWPLGPEWKKVSEERRDADAKNPHGMTFYCFERSVYR